MRSEYVSRQREQVERHTEKYMQRARNWFYSRLAATGVMFYEFLDMSFFLCRGEDHVVSSYMDHVDNIGIFLAAGMFSLIATEKIKKYAKTIEDSNRAIENAKTLESRMDKNLF